jgi:DNA invertase Pin-like site-specific DNA recombinase
VPRIGWRSQPIPARHVVRYLAQSQSCVHRDVDGSGGSFVACDNPHANKLTVHILAAVAEHEREMISERTKAAVAAAKARGTRLGNPRLSEVQAIGRATVRGPLPQN